MASVIALRALLGASLGLGALDLVWMNVALAPRVFAGEPAPAPAPVPALAAGSPAALEASPPPPLDAEPLPTTPEVASESILEPRTDRVYFTKASAVLDATAEERLKELADAAGGGAVFSLEGHADHRGDEKFNRVLSKQRALAVANHLARLGIARSRIRVDYLGEARASGGGELWRDRRVEIQITGGPR